MLCSVYPAPLHGEWGQWSPWSICKGTCPNSEGIQTRNRACDNPAPLNGGKNCTGDSVETIKCRIQCESGAVSISTTDETITGTNGSMAEKSNMSFVIIMSAIGGGLFVVVIGASVLLVIVIRHRRKAAERKRANMYGINNQTIYQENAYQGTTLVPPTMNTVNMFSDMVRYPPTSTFTANETS